MTVPAGMVSWLISVCCQFSPSRRANVCASPTLRPTTSGATALRLTRVYTCTTPKASAASTHAAARPDSTSSAMRRRLRRLRTGVRRAVPCPWGLSSRMRAGCCVGLTAGRGPEDSSATVAGSSLPSLAFMRASAISRAL